MSRPWSEFTFELETLSGALYQVSAETYLDGTYDEPELGLESEPLLRSLSSDTWLTADEAGLTAKDQERLESAVERRLYDLTTEYASEMGQEIAESAADALHEAWRDRDYE